MEYATEGELFNYIVKKNRLSDYEASNFLFQIVNGVEFIHNNNIVHRDLKPENLLMTSQKIIKLIDFGLSNHYSDNSLLSTPCGSPCYASPEMIMGKKYSGIKIDIWSIGIILFAMICGYLPFEDEANQVLFKKILKGKIDFPDYIPPLFKDLISKILVSDPDQRITIEKIKQHPVYIQGKEVYLTESESFIKKDDRNNIRSFSAHEVISVSNENTLEPNDNIEIISDKEDNSRKAVTVLSIQKIGGMTINSEVWSNVQTETADKSFNRSKIHSARARVTLDLFETQTISKKITTERPTTKKIDLYSTINSSKTTGSSTIQPKNYPNYNSSGYLKPRNTTRNIITHRSRENSADNTRTQKHSLANSIEPYFLQRLHKRASLPNSNNNSSGSNISLRNTSNPKCVSQTINKKSKFHSLYTNFLTKNGIYSSNNKSDKNSQLPSQVILMKEANTISSKQSINKMNATKITDSKSKMHSLVFETYSKINKKTIKTSQPKLHNNIINLKNSNDFIMSPKPSLMKELKYSSQPKNNKPSLFHSKVQKTFLNETKSDKKMPESLNSIKALRKLVLK